ncbi:MAG: hypothetical protein E6370_15365 [Clostridiales bacterium]|jgi:uncharacterized protein YycO|nr:hypothetical protein [Clostridiales bacterium]MDU6975680.1 hypothetical protein [Clostridiales bacterium]
MKKLKRSFIIVGSILGIAVLIYVLLGFHARNNMFFVPEVEYVDLMPILKQTSFSEEDYNTLYHQTGLAAPMIDILKKEPDFEETILSFQTKYLNSPRIVKTAMTPVTNIDVVQDETGKQVAAFELAPYDNGYIFLTKSTYTYNWRHGHAGIVIDKVRGKVLESLEPFTVSMEQNASKWTLYPTFKMMRLKDTDQDQLDEIARYAAENMQGIPYNILAMKNNKPVPSSTHCSHIIWHTFNQFGIDLDSSGGIFVSPGDIGRSPYLETLQIYGFNPDKDW